MSGLQITRRVSSGASFFLNGGFLGITDMNYFGTVCIAILAFALLSHGSEFPLGHCDYVPEYEYGFPCVDYSYIFNRPLSIDTCSLADRYNESTGCIFAIDALLDPMYAIGYPWYELDEALRLRAAKVKVGNFARTVRR